MKNLRDRPIRQKITIVITLISSVVLLLACAALFAIQAYTLKQHSTHELGRHCPDHRSQQRRCCDV